MSDLSIEQAIAEMRDLVRCRCHPAFTERKLHDPDCNCDSAEAVEVLANALTAVQPVMESGHWKDHCRTNNGPDICDEPCRKCLAKPPFSLPAVQPSHVNETPKSEHEAAVMLTPATKGGDA